MNYNNPYERKLERIQRARKQWNESEWRLSFLRTIEPQPIPTPKDEEICLWNQQLSRPTLN